MAKLTVADIPHMIKMWDHELNTDLPENVSVYCKKPKYWRCPDCGYYWTTSPSARYDSTGKCPCHELNKVIRKGVNDVLTLVKGLSSFIDESNNFDEICTQGVDSKLLINFKCDECGRKWTATLKSQIRKEENGGYIATGCPHYNTSKRKKSEVPFCSEVESIIRFWDDKNPLDPTTTRSNSTEKAHFICKNCGYEWTTEIRTQGRGKNSGQCKCCERHLVLRKGYSDVFTLVPESKKFYNFDKNKDIDIYSICLSDSKTLIDWKCPVCGYEWQACLADRIKGKKGEYSFVGCHYCYLHSKERITSIASNPKLLKYWDFEKNEKKGLAPNLTSANADIPAAWRCKECGYEWESNIRSRTNSNGKCPFCESKNKPIRKGVNDILTLCPELEEIYDFDYNAQRGINIYKEGVYSKKSAHFKCKKCGHEWDSYIATRVKKEPDGTYTLTDCPKCSNKNHRQIPYSVEYPLLHQMYRYDLNSISLDSITGSKALCETKYYWTCLVCGETFESTLETMLNSQKYQTKGCPFCGRVRLRKGESFADLHSELMDEYAPTNTIDPYTVFPNNKELVDWICRDCGHKWTASFSLRHKGGGNCPVCNRTALIPDKNSFAAVYPDYVKYWADSNKRKANEVFYNSTEWFRFICPVCGEIHGSYIDNFVKGESCPYCKGIKLSPKTNSLKALYPDLARRWSPNNSFGPDTVFPTSWEWVKWICDTCDGEYSALVKDVVNGEDECPYCTGKRALPGKTSLKALYPDVAKMLSPNDVHDADMILPTTTTSYMWRCPECNYDYHAPVREMINGYTCPYCNERQVMPGFNSFGDKHPDLVAEMDEVANYLLSKSPYEVLDTSNYKFWFTCKNNPKHKYFMSPRTRLMFQKRGREPCLYCRGHRRKLNRFISHNKKTAVK